MHFELNVIFHISFLRFSDRQLLNTSATVSYINKCHMPSHYFSHTGSDDHAAAAENHTSTEARTDDHDIHLANDHYVSELVS